MVVLLSGDTADVRGPSSAWSYASESAPTGSAFHSIPINHRRVVDDVFANEWDYCESLHGGTREYPGMVSNRMLLTNLPHVRTVCETGLAQDHSGLIFLHGNPNVTLYAFEIMEYGTEYKEHCVQYMRGLYGDRFQLVVGNSSIVVPRAHRYFPSLRCDLMSVGSSAMSDRFSDMVNFQHIASCNSLVLHTISLQAKDEAAARTEAQTARTPQWKLMIERGDIEELYCHVVKTRNTSSINPLYAMDCVGKYRVLRPDCIGTSLTRKDAEYNAFVASAALQTQVEAARGATAAPITGRQTSLGMLWGSHPVYETGAFDRALRPCADGGGTRIHEGNPIVAAADLWDITASSVSDGLLIRHGDWWYVFFVCDGRVAYAVSIDSTYWRYGGVVLSGSESGGALRFPFTIEWKSKVYMVVVGSEAGTIELYEATSFPDGWVRVKSESFAGLPSGLQTPVLHVDDTTDTVYLFAGSSLSDGKLFLFCMDASSFPAGEWVPHSKSPMGASDAMTAGHRNQDVVSKWSGRMAGHVVTVGGQLYRFGSTADNRVYAWQIDSLSRSEYSERGASGVPGSGELEWAGGPARRDADTASGKSKAVVYGSWRAGGVSTWDALPRVEHKGQWMVVATGVTAEGGTILPNPPKSRA